MSRQEWMILAAVLGLIGAGAAGLAYQRDHQRLGVPGVRVVAEPVLGESGQVLGTHSAYLPARVLNYESKLVPVPKLVYDWLPKDTVYGHRLFMAPDGFIVDNNIVLMGADRTSIHQPQYCLTGAGWSIQVEERVKIPIAQPHPYLLETTRLLTTGQVKDREGRNQTVRGIYVYWFVADRQLTADHQQRMWWLARDLIRTGVLQRWAYVSCMSYCQPGHEEATFERMKQFIAAAVPQFQLATGPVAQQTARP